MFRRPQYVALLVVFCLVVLFLSLPDRATSQIKLALGSLFLPLFGLAGSTQRATEQAGAALRPRRALVEELELLRRENLELKLQSMQSTQVWAENQRLREAVAWQRQAPWRTKLARVTLRDPANWWRAVHINLGERDGLRTNLPVVTPQGLIGRITQVAPQSAIVALVGDPNCRVSALIEPEAGTKPAGAARGLTHGVVASGSSSLLTPSLVDLTYVDRQSAVKPGQRVVTSGLGGIFPRGILIGHVVDAALSPSGLYTEARLQLAADVSHLDELFVLLP